MPRRIDEEEEKMNVKDKAQHKPLLGQMPISAPVRWMDMQDECPYPNPECEYIRSPFPLSLNALAARWEGMWELWRIEHEYAINHWEMKRTQYWEEVNKETLESYKTEDVGFQKRILKEDIMRSGRLIEVLVGNIIEGVEYQKTRDAGSFGYVKMPMQVESISKLTHAFVAASNLRATRADIATKISRNEVEIGPDLKSRLDAQRKAIDPEYEKLMALAMGGGRIFESGEREPGVPIRDVTAEARVVPFGEYEVVDEELDQIRRNV